MRIITTTYIQGSDMFETLDTMIALAVIYMILSMINKFILSGIKRVLNLKFRIMARELKGFASTDLLAYLHVNNASPTFMSDYTNRLSGINKDDIRTMTELKGCIEGFLSRERIEDIAGYLDIDITGKTQRVVEAKAMALKARGRLEACYNSTMEIISRRYIMYMRYFAIATGLIIAVAMNADFFVIYKSITENSTIRTQLVAQAEGISERMKTLNDEIESKLKTDAGRKEIASAVTSTRKGIGELTGKVKGAGLRLGWEHEPWPGYEKTEDGDATTKDASSTTEEVKATPGEGPEEEGGEWIEGGRRKWALNKVIGLIASALLIGFGAPFWHDLLTSLVGIKKVLRTRGNKSEGAGSVSPEG